MEEKKRDEDPMPGNECALGINMEEFQSDPFSFLTRTPVFQMPTPTPVPPASKHTAGFPAAQVTGAAVRRQKCVM